LPTRRRRSTWSDVFRNSAAAGAVVDEALRLDPPPRVVWMQLGVINEAAAARGRTAGLTIVMNRCPSIETRRLLSPASDGGGHAA
jgi:predicted CoA-binding protein